MLTKEYNEANFEKLFMSRDFWETIVIILIAVVIFVGLRISIQTYIVYGPVWNLILER